MPVTIEGRAHVLLGDLLIVVQGAGLHDHLEVLEAGAVVELDEAEGLHVADGSGPPADGHVLTAVLVHVRKDAGDLCPFHIGVHPFNR